MLVVKSKIAQLTNYWIRWSWRENIKLEDKIEDFYKEKRNIGKEMKMLSQLNFDILESDFTNNCEELERCKTELVTTQI